MRRKDREITDRSKMLEVINSGKYAVISLCKEDEPYVVTMSYGFDESADTFFFHGAEEGQKIEFIKANPKACLTVIQDNGYLDGRCTHAYRSVIVRGEMVLIDDPEERVSAVKVMIDHLESDGRKILRLVEDSNKTWQGTQMFKLKVESITCKERPVSEND
jgi:nitroimidazol reductase NimA-like FMN-containing flavoprotein (pyridoxamine 5'-phosphate oxidase superfamily)